MFKNLLLGILAYVGINGAVAFAQDSSRVEDILLRVNIKPSYSAHLIVNTKNLDYKVSFLTEGEGIDDMRNNVDTSSYEEAYIYDRKTKVWTEVGYNETGWLLQSNQPANWVTLDHTLCNKLFDECDSLSAYHQHPAKDYPIPDFADTIKFPIYKAEGKIYDKFGIKPLIYTLSPIPSEQDIETMIRQSTYFYEKHPEGNIKSGIISHLGVTEYGLTERGKKFVSDYGTIIFNNRFKDIILMSYLNGELTSHFSGDKLDDLEGDCINVAKSVIEQWNGDLIYIKFYPYRSLYMIENKK